MIKIASYNFENLFDRANAFSKGTSEAQRVLKEEAELNALFQKPAYTVADKKRMLELLKSLGILKTDEGPFVYFRRIRGKFINRTKTGFPTIEANGRDEWVGWVELKTTHVNAVAVENTGRVIRDVNADIVAVIEAEHRVALKQFSDFVLEKVNGKPYAHVMLIDGNDDRGIDVGLMTQAGFPIGIMRSHIHDLDGDNKPIFSRDCPEYCVDTPDWEQIWILPNQFKSKFAGNNPASIAKRKSQARRTAAIYKNLIADGEMNVVVLGDFNDTPDSKAMKPLLNTSLKDISEYPSFGTGEFPGKGTFGLGNDKDKIDYLLLSPALFARVH